MLQRNGIFGLGWALLLGGLVSLQAGCIGDASADAGHGDEEPPPAAQREDFSIELQGGHAHVFEETSLTFTVRAFPRRTEEEVRRPGLDYREKLPRYRQA